MGHATIFRPRKHDKHSGKQPPSIEDRNKVKSMEAAFQGADANNLDNGPIAYKCIGLLAAMKQTASALEGRSQSSENMLLGKGRITKWLKDFHWYWISTLHAVDGSGMQILIEWLEYERS